MFVMVKRPGEAAFFSLAFAFLLAACGDSKPADTPLDRRAFELELSELEVHASGVDRFAHCPSSGSLGQAWIPAHVSEAPHDSAVTERAIELTLKPFRSCYTKGTLHRSNGDGRAAIAARVGPGGKIVAVENYATCGLPIDVVDCMVTEVSHLSIEAPADGSTRTVVIPAVFAPRNGYAGSGGGASATEAYAAEAYVVMEQARPGLHQCEARSRTGATLAQAQGLFTLQLDPQGRILQQQVEPWSGPEELKACTSAVLSKLGFSSPPEGGARIHVRIAFNPRRASP
ncbi:hypothetical protein LVJ94_04020 [Pendulispora rubella]|uniref:AgmX/PglI C-terminal domain-containing protein n=1 Tax=Pendulispora rubella TaxID=2741070 RepID=A0ABZ2L646_9BACT